MNKIFIRYFSASLGLRSSAGKMKGILVKNFGGPEACEYETNIPIPEPNDDQIQIRVHAAGVNPIDTYIRAGKHERRPKLPFTPGMDSAGIVSRLGKNVKDFKVGDRVFTTDSDTGTYAEYTLTKPKNTYQLADNISFEEGSGIGIPYFTAYKALFLKANSKPGETVLVHGASGATGLATVQLAKAHGMKVIGTAGTQSGLDLIKKQGADYSFNHRDSNYIEEIKTNFPNGLDLIVEMLANINLNNDLKLLKYKKGKVAIIGNRGTIEINPRLLMINETSIFGVIQYSTTHEEFIMMNHHLGAMFKSNVIKPLIGRRYKLSEAGKAQHDVINNTGSGGKLTLIVD